MLGMPRVHYFIKFPCEGSIRKLRPRELSDLPAETQPFVPPLHLSISQDGLILSISTLVSLRHMQVLLRDLQHVDSASVTLFFVLSIVHFLHLKKKIPYISNII